MPGPLEALRERKSLRLLEARMLDDSGRHNEAVKLFEQVAKEEEQIAKHLRKAGRDLDAAVNLVSAASCWQKAHNTPSALALLDEALMIGEIPENFRREIDTFRATWLPQSSQKALRRRVLASVRPVLAHGVVSTVLVLATLVLDLVAHRLTHPQPENGFLSVINTSLLYAILSLFSLSMIMAIFRLAWSFYKGSESERMERGVETSKQTDIASLEMKRTSWWKGVLLHLGLQEAGLVILVAAIVVFLKVQFDLQRTFLPVACLALVCSMFLRASDPEEPHVGK